MTLCVGVTEEMFVTVEVSCEVSLKNGLVGIAASS